MASVDLLYMQLVRTFGRKELIAVTIFSMITGSSPIRYKYYLLLIYIIIYDDNYILVISQYKWDIFVIT